MLPRPESSLEIVCMGSKPDDLVEKPVCAEDHIEHQPGIVNGVMTEVEIERSVRRQNTMHLNQAKFQEAQILFKREIISVFNRRDHFEWIGPTSEAATGPVTPTGSDGIQAP